MKKTLGRLEAGSKAPKHDGEEDEDGNGDGE